MESADLVDQASCHGSQVHGHVDRRYFPVELALQDAQMDGGDHVLVDKYLYRFLIGRDNRPVTICQATKPSINQRWPVAPQTKRDCEHGQ